MKTNTKALFAALLLLSIFNCADLKGQWGIQEEKAYSLFHTVSDKDNIDEYNVYFENGKMADRICNLYAPPYYWTNEKKIRYKKEAQLIYDELKDGNKYLAKRLEKKISAYDQFIE